MCGGACGGAPSKLQGDSHPYHLWLLLLLLLLLFVLRVLLLLGSGAQRAPRDGPAGFGRRPRRASLQ